LYARRLGRLRADSENAEAKGTQQKSFHLFTLTEFNAGRPLPLRWQQGLRFDD
jgi:hypothetical protein